MVSHAINDKFDSSLRKELNFPRPKDSENYDVPYLSLVEYIVNCTRNHAITSTNHHGAEISVI